MIPTHTISVVPFKGKPFQMTLSLPRQISVITEMHYQTLKIKELKT